MIPMILELGAAWAVVMVAIGIWISEGAEDGQGVTECEPGCDSVTDRSDWVVSAGRRARLGDGLGAVSREWTREANRRGEL